MMVVVVVIDGGDDDDDNGDRRMSIPTGTILYHFVIDVMVFVPSKVAVMSRLLRTVLGQFEDSFRTVLGQF